ncbi:hypothetical protein ACVR05_07330 [Streptococcus caprae]|uniref:hypothetical protein n=1 Tax=Streptococcus caprae TaxID=1640501 RepID=UPI0036D208EF
MNNKTIDEEYQKRYKDFGTTKTQLFPNLVKRGSFASNQFELFSVPLNEIQLLNQQI